MTERADSGGVLASPAAALTGLVGRLGAALRHPGRDGPPPSPAPDDPRPGPMTVADLVSARGMAPERAAPPTVEAPPLVPERAVEEPDDERVDEPAGDPDVAPVEEPAEAPDVALAEPVPGGEEPAASGSEPVAAPEPVAPPPVDTPAEPAAGPSARPAAAAVVGPGVRASAGSVSGAIEARVDAKLDTEVDTGVEEPPEALQPPADVDLLAPPWARFVLLGGRAVAPAPLPPGPAGDLPVDEHPADDDLPDPAAATDRITRPRAATRPGPAPPAPRAPTRFSVAPRPTVVDDLAITGLTRRSRGRWGSRLFLAFFVFVYVVILLQLVNSLLQPTYR